MYVLSKKIFLVSNDLVWQLMVTPLRTCLDLQVLFVNFYLGIIVPVLLDVYALKAQLVKI
jgi:hypothetical protein